MAPIPLTQTATSTITTTTTTTKTVTEPRESCKLFTHPEICRKTNQSTEKCYFGETATNRLPPWHRRPQGQSQVPERANKKDFKEFAQDAAQNLKKSNTSSIRSCN